MSCYKQGNTLLNKIMNVDATFSLIINKTLNSIQSVNKTML